MKRLRLIIAQKGDKLSAEFIGEDPVVFDKAFERLVHDKSFDTVARFIYPAPATIRYPAIEQAAIAAGIAKREADEKAEAESKAKKLQADADKARAEAAALPTTAPTAPHQKPKK